MSSKNQVVVAVEPGKAVTVAGPAVTKLVLLDGAAIDKLITSITNRSAKLATDIHYAAVQGIMHAQQHGDPRKVDRLLNGLHGANGPAAFKAWVEEHSPIRWNGDGVVGILKATDKRFTPFNAEAANATPYWTKIDVKAGPLTLAKLKAMIATMEKKVKKAEAGEIEVGDGENVIDMRAFVDKLKRAA